MRKLSNQDFDNYIKGLQNSQKTFIIERKRNVKALILNHKLLFLNRNRLTFSNDERKLAVNLFSRVKKNVNSFLGEENFIIDKVKNRCSSTNSNSKKYKSLKPEASFYYIDIKHCYWRIAYLKGYISKRLYDDVLSKPKFKTFRNMALACIVAPKIRDYYIEGIKVNTIVEDKRHYRIVYDNIRFTAYNTMGHCMKIAKVGFLGYRTDGIMLLESALKGVENYLKKENLDYRITRCFKIDDFTFNYGKSDKIIRF